MGDHVGGLASWSSKAVAMFPVMSSSFTRIFVVLALAFAAGCGGGGSAENPPGGRLLNQAADVLQSVTSLSLSLRTANDPDLNVRSVDADLLRSGDAQGSVRVSELGLPVQLDFVVVGKTAYLKGLTGGWQREPLAKIAGIYDPSAILDPNRGLVKLLRTATGASTTGREKLAGQDAYKVHATLPQAAVAGVVPGLKTATPADMWITVTGHRLLKAQLELARQGGGKPGTATVTFADFGKPFVIKAPV
jgi:lipoprotein LprG